ncbi:YjzD family protein [Dolosicoccus paucivorans]|uniref:DUF2929 domain-containing protein n=1 Tax=Dolosicoccus paucivorans TaxID=84521 RepID=A0A1G8M5E4_9LACT|nr:YjzD family protein [Dolosicoccus paucivorans]PMB85106.1 DUF2929 domain-containing protein [Dolosicoccus paucivorans]PMC58908.1 DUF2929 domain-containing protein [Dolosicoccus paucivorans]SDI63154.1 Protein of unknown function [Dolosicoccus paucivorans]
MKYITTLFWGFILGHIVYYLGSSLTSMSYDFYQATYLGITVSVAVFILSYILNKITYSSQHVE